MSSKFGASVFALLVTLATLASSAGGAPPYAPTPWTPNGASQGPGPQLQACNVPGASSLGWGGNAAGSNTGYHTYANAPGTAAVGDGCISLFTGPFLTCTQGTVLGGAPHTSLLRSSPPL